MPVLHMRSLTTLSALALAASLAGCIGEDKGSGPQRDKSKAKIRLIPVMEPTSDAALARRVAGGTGAGLESFQVAVEMVYLAQDITISGSGWSNPTRALSLFEQRPLMTETHNVINAANAMDAANDGYYIDFMTAAGRSRLASSGGFTSEDLGDYNFVIVNWAMPFRVRGSVDLGGGHTVYTKAGTYDAGTRTTVAASDMLTGPAQTTIAVKNNGGTWFRFLRPLTLHDSDLTTTRLVRDTSRRDSLGNVIDTLVPAGQLNVMLVFNPDDFLTGWDSAYQAGDGSGPMPRGPTATELMGPGGMGNIHVPFLDATVIPFRTGEEVWRETYVLTGEDPADRGFDFRTRFEVYTVGDNVMATSLRGLVGPDGEFPLESMNVFFVQAGAGGTLDFQDHARGNVVGGFHRLSTLGATGTANLTLGHMNVPACTYSLVEKRRMN